MLQRTGHIATQAGWVVTVRHGAPGLSHNGRFDAKGWDAWWAQYDRTGLAPGQIPPAALSALADEADVFLSSTLPRARETLDLLAGTGQGARNLGADPLFVEAPLPSPPFPGMVKLSPRSWGVVARLCWLMGHAGAGETRGQAEIRARAAAENLIAAAVREGNVMLCAHGWFNRMLGTAMQRRGWRQVSRNGGDNYWSWRRYEPPAPKRL